MEIKFCKCGFCLTLLQQLIFIAEFLTNIYDIEIPNSFFTRICPIELDVFIEGKVDPFLQKGVDSTEIPVGQLG